MLDDSYAKTVNGILGKDSKWQFSFDGVALQWIGDTITAILLDDDGKAVETKEYSVHEYLTNLQAMPIELFPQYTPEKYQAMQRLINDLLIYGGEAQKFTSHNTKNLVSEGVSGTVFVPLTKTDKSVARNGEHVRFSGMTVYFDSSNKLIFRFSSENLTGVTFKLKVEDGEETEIGYTVDGAQYMISTESIKAVGFDDVYTITAYKDNVAGATVTYSVKSYVYAKQNSAEGVAALVKATYNYGLSAKAFASAK